MCFIQKKIFTTKHARMAHPVLLPTYVWRSCSNHFSEAISGVVSQPLPLFRSHKVQCLNISPLAVAAETSSLSIFKSRVSWKSLIVSTSVGRGILTSLFSLPTRCAVIENRILFLPSILVIAFSNLSFAANIARRLCHCPPFCAKLWPASELAQCPVSPHPHSVFFEAPPFRAHTWRSWRDLLPCPFHRRCSPWNSIALPAS